MQVCVTLLSSAPRCLCWGWGRLADVFQERVRGSVDALIGKRGLGSQRCVRATQGLPTGCCVRLSVDVTKLRDMLLLNEARHFHGNTSLCSQPDAKPLNYIFQAESTSIVSSLQSNGSVGTPDASTSFPTFKQSLRGALWGPRGALFGGKACK